MSEVLVRAFSGFGAIGIVVCGIRQVPPIWAVDPLDAVTVAGALLMAVTVLALRVFGERMFG